MDDVTIRSARPDDIGELLDFWSRAGENDARPADTADPVRRLLRHDPDAVIVGDLDGRIVATIVAGRDGWRANLYRLAVDPAHRGHGLGRRMLAAAEERLYALGANRYCAMVLDDNERGTALWASAGYTRQDDWHRWVRSADPTPT